MKKAARKPIALALSALMLATTMFSAGVTPLTGWAEEGETVQVNPLEVNSQQPKYLKGDVTVWVKLDSMQGNFEDSNGFTKAGLFDNKKETGGWTQDMSGSNLISESNPAWFSFMLEKAQPSRSSMESVITTYSMVSVNNTSMGDEAKNKTRDPRDWKFFGSKDGKDWVLLDTQVNQEFKERGEQKVYTFENTESYAYYKLEVTQNWGQDGTGNNVRTGLADFRIGTGKDIDLASEAGMYWNAGAEWAAAATEEEKAETMQAFSTEYNRQLDLYNYCIGVSGRVHNQSATTGVQCESLLSDNVTSPWGDDRHWAQMSAPFSGMAFTVKGYMAKSQPDSNSGAALSNQVALEDEDGTVWYYQTFRNQTWKLKADGSQTAPEKINVGVGTGAASADLKEAMEYAYAESAWNLMNPGYNDGKQVQTEDNVTYQVFYGYDSAGKEGDKTGVSYIAGLTSGVAGAYVISDEIFNAWQKTWADGKKFAASGAPISAAEVDNNGDLRQTFENMIFVQDKETGEVKTYTNDSAITDFSLGEGVEVVRSTETTISASEKKLTFIVKDGTDLTSLAPTYTCKEGAEPASGTARDFSNSFENPLVYSNPMNTLYVTVMTESQSVESDASVQLLKARLDLLPETDKIAKTHRSLIVLAKAEYNSLDDTQKMLLGDAYAQKLEEAEKALLAQEKDHKLRILCVGSSTTEGVGSSNSNLYSYPAQLQTLLGKEGYEVINKGVGGTTVADKGGRPYRQEARYRESLTCNPDLVLMFVGSNDADSGAWYRTDIDYPANFRESYIALMNDYLSLDSQPTVVVTYPYRTDGWAGRDEIVPNVIIPMLNEIAAEYDCPILDLYEPTNFGQIADNFRDLMPDGLHPNDQGYAYIAAAAHDFVSSYSEANLAELKAGDTAIQLTDRIYDYGFQVSGDTLPTVTAKAADPEAEVTITQASADKPYAEIFVEAEKYTAYYRLTFVTDPADMAGQELAADIAATGQVNYENLEEFKELRTRLDALTIQQKAHVLNESELKVAELTVNELSVNYEAVKPVIEKIEAVKDYNDPSQTAAVREARAAYQTLTADQQALVSNIDLLIAAEAKVPTVDPVYYATELLEKLGDSASYRDAPVVREAVPFIEGMEAADKAKLDTDLLDKLEAAEAAVAKSADNFNVTINESTWRSSGYTETPWMHNVSAADKRATAEAMADELKYEYVVNGYALGRTSGSYNIDAGWGEMVLIQIDGENGTVPTDNVTRPWADQPQRYWSMLTAPFVGMSFSQKGYFATGGTGEALLGNSFAYQGKVYQVFWDAVRSHDDVPLDKSRAVEVSSIRNFPGSSDKNADLTNNTFRYAYASYSQANKWENGTLGIPAGYAVSDEASGVIYQAFEGPEGTAYIAGAADDIAKADPNGGHPEGAYGIPAVIADALAEEGDTPAAIFATMGAPVSDVSFQGDTAVQQFEKLDITVKADGSYTLTPHVDQSLEDAEEAVQAAVEAIAATNATTADDILAAAEAVITNKDIVVEVASFEKTEATAGQNGSIQAVITLTLGDQTAQVTVELTIEKLPEEIVPGDLDKDGEVTIADVMEACKVMARESAGTDPTDDEIARGDLDGDGEITIADVMEICKILARQG